MKPRRIILIRHGECHANNDESKFATEPDYTIELTAKGVEQARRRIGLFLHLAVLADSLDL